MFILCNEKAEIQSKEEETPPEPLVLAIHDPSLQKM
jgi:hypothetical protein